MCRHAPMLLGPMLLRLHVEHAPPLAPLLDSAPQVGKVSHSGEEVLALKRLIQRCTADQEKLREQIGRNKDKDEFLMAHRYGQGGWREQARMPGGYSA